MSPKFHAQLVDRRLVRSTRLAPGRALGVCINKPVLLHVEHGHLWITLGEPDGGTPSASGDWFLAPGDSLLMPAGAQVVMEADTSRNGETPVRFKWSEAVAVNSSRFARDVIAPAGEVVSALWQAGAALTRVFNGLLGFLIGGPTKRSAAALCLGPRRS